MEKIFYFHSRPTKEHKSYRVTVAGITDDLNVKGDKKVLKIGASICSPKDHFTKTKGRMVAEGRAKSSKAIRVESKDSFKKGKNITKTLISYAEILLNSIGKVEKLKWNLGF